MPLVSSPVRSVVSSPAGSVLGDAGGGGAFSLDSLSSYIDINVKDRANLDGSGSSFTTLTDVGSIGATWSPTASVTYIDTAGFNDGAPGAVQKSGTNTSRYLSTDGGTTSWTAGALPASACLLAVYKPGNTAGNWAVFGDVFRNDYALLSQNGSASSHISGTTATAAYINQTAVSTQDNVYDQHALTDGNETFPYSYSRVEGMDMSTMRALRLPAFQAVGTSLAIARLIIIDQSEYDANKDDIDTAMLALRDEYRTG